MPTNDTTTESTDDRPEAKTLRSGDEVHEADDCRFVSSPAGTVHERREWPGDAHDYDYHPKCGQRLPAGSMWSWVEADSPAEAVLKYDLKPCSKCIENSHELDRQRKKRHSALVMDHVDEKTYPFEEDDEKEVATDGGTDQGPLSVFASDDPTDEPNVGRKDVTVADVGAEVFVTSEPRTGTDDPGDDRTVQLLQRGDAERLLCGLIQTLGRPLEWEIGINEAGDEEDWAHYHPLAATESVARERALEEARDDFTDPYVYMAQCVGEPSGIREPSHVRVVDDV